MSKYKGNISKHIIFHQILPIVSFMVLLGIGCTIQKPFVEDVGDWSQSQVRSGTATLHAKTIGEGTPILVIHGGPGLSHQYFLPHLLGLTESGYQLIFYDQRNAGQSSSIIDSNDISLDWYINDMMAVLDHYQVDQVTLLAHSWGSTLALPFALRYPERIQSIILLNPNAPSDTLAQQENQAMIALQSPEDQDTIQKLMKSQRFQNQEVEAYADLFELNFRTLFYDRTFADDLAIELPDDFVSRNGMLRYLHKDFKFYDITYLLEEITAPTMIVYGVHEPGATISGPIYESKIPNGELLILPRCGHFPFIEQPYTLFKELDIFITWHADE